jgi:hypothetical protein
MKKTYSLLGMTLGIFLFSEAQAAANAKKWGGIYDGPQERVVHHSTGPKVDHKLEARRELIRKEINGAHKRLSQFSGIYGKMHDLRVQVAAMNVKTPDQRHLLKLEKEWIAAQTKLRVDLVKKKVPAFDKLPTERDIWDAFQDEEARSLEAKLREILHWQSYENTDLQTGQAKQQGNLYDEESTRSHKKMDPRSMRFSDLKDLSDDEEDF